ncbi:hypothetical protein BD560DRAFT_486464 [Blakeslea trispora]|nr:hypothetical protein BD560DRAFT_429815 [Blakeslea trispora]KAI8386890.1 hypothetical protein BD560DRAFT_486464 [Blakeslea trispora]
MLNVICGTSIVRINFVLNVSHNITAIAAIFYFLAPLEDQSNYYCIVRINTVYQLSKIDPDLVHPQMVLVIFVKRKKSARVIDETDYRSKCWSDQQETKAYSIHVKLS